MESAREFELGDCVTLKFEDGLFQVSGFIHDSERLFIADDSGGEFEVKFNDVTDQWRNLKSLKARDAAIRKECADRAVAWYLNGLPDYSEIRAEYADEVENLRAAIMGDKHE